MASLLSDDDIAGLGLAAVGTDVRIDRRAAIFVPSRIRIGSHVRIDAFAVIAGGAAELRLGSFVHIGASSYLSAGDGGIDIGDFSTVAPRCSFHGHSDDYTGGMLTGGVVDPSLTGGEGGPIVLEPHVIVGSASVVLQNVRLGYGCAIGAMTRVHRDVASGDVVAGNPMRTVGRRVTSRLEELGRRAWEIQ